MVDDYSNGHRLHQCSRAFVDAAVSSVLTDATSSSHRPSICALANASLLVLLATRTQRVVPWAVCCALCKGIPADDRESPTAYRRWTATNAMDVYNEEIHVRFLRVTPLIRYVSLAPHCVNTVASLAIDGHIPWVTSARISLGCDSVSSQCTALFLSRCPFEELEVELDGEALEKLPPLRETSGSCLRHLKVLGRPPAGPVSCPLSMLLSAAGAGSSVQRLHIECEASPRDFTGALAAVSNMELLPAVTELFIVTSSVPAAASILFATVPVVHSRRFTQLTTLSLDGAWHGDSDIVGCLPLEAILFLLKPGAAPRLEALGLRHCGLTNETMEFFVEALDCVQAPVPALPCVTQLDFEGNYIDDVGASHLLSCVRVVAPPAASDLSQHTAVAIINVVNLRGNRLSLSACQTLSHTAPPTLTLHVSVSV